MAVACGRYQRGEIHERDELVMFASEIPIYGSFKLTAFDDEWKLVQEMEQDQLDHGNQLPFQDRG